jgi:hypothetical protein
VRRGEPAAGSAQGQVTLSGGKPVPFSVARAENCRCGKRAHELDKLDYMKNVEWRITK